MSRVLKILDRLRESNTQTNESFDQDKFFEYVWSFYGKGGVYANFFNPALSKDELKKSISIFLKNEKDPVGDTFDRELVRDLLFLNRLEHKKKLLKMKGI